MEKYIWKGINLHGANCKGVMFANSVDDLKKQMLKNNIALTYYKKKKNISFLSNIFQSSFKIALAQKVSFFDDLSILMGSGMELIPALKLVKKEIKNYRFIKEIESIIENVEKGGPFWKCLQDKNDTFDFFIIQTIKVAENSGKLPFALKSISQHLNLQLRLIKKLKKAAIMPLFTLIFASIIFLGIFIWVIPQFEVLFSNLEKDIPRSTKFLFKISLFLRSEIFFYAIGAFLLIIVIAKIILPKKIKQTITEKIKTPFSFFIKKTVLEKNLISFLETLSLLLKSGLPLKQALDFSVETITNRKFKKEVSNVSANIISGQTFSEALKQGNQKYFPEKLSALVFIGEQSGNLDLMLYKAAEIFQDKLNKKINLLTTLFQPFLIIFIGILIAGIMFTVYLPLFNVASLF
ncbi:hypothetical protein GF322_02905 [Candidatus Dependentiae bacterium]|nr:hypothetical protein [Candidatus Dependentiae bacterium]